MKKGSDTVEKLPLGWESFSFPAGTFLIDLRSEFVQVGDSFPAAVVVVCGAGKRFFQPVTGFASIAFGYPPNALENPNP